MRLVYALLAIVVLAPLQASAAPPANADPGLSPWFQSLQTANGNSCCGVADCRNYPVTITDGRYTVLYEGKQLPVPPETISTRTDNPTGDYIACVQRDFWYAGEQKGPFVLCFFRAPQT